MADFLCLEWVSELWPTRRLGQEQDLSPNHSRGKLVLPSAQPSPSLIRHRVGHMDPSSLGL